MHGRIATARTAPAGTSCEALDPRAADRGVLSRLSHSWLTRSPEWTKESAYVEPSERARAPRVALRRGEGRACLGARTKPLAALHRHPRLRARAGRQRRHAPAGAFPRAR